MVSPLKEKIKGESASSPLSNKRRKLRRRVTIRNFLEAITVALLIALVLRIWVVQSYRITSGSMEDTLLVGDYVLVNKLVYDINQPSRGDVVVFKYPHQDNQMNPLKWLAETGKKLVGIRVPERRDMLKRIIGLPGEEVLIKSGVVYIDGFALDEPYLKNLPDYEWGPKKVPADNYFVLGDNRSESDDSHRWGFVPEELISGRVELVFWSWIPCRCSEQVLRLKTGASEQLLLLPCDGKFEELDRETARAHLSPADFASADKFYICQNCGRIYRHWWDGSDAPAWKFWELIRLSRLFQLVE